MNIGNPGYLVQMLINGQTLRLSSRDTLQYDGFTWDGHRVELRQIQRQVGGSLSIDLDLINDDLSFDALFIDSDPRGAPVSVWQINAESLTLSANDAELLMQGEIEDVPDIGDIINIGVTSVGRLAAYTPRHRIAPPFCNHITPVNSIVDWGGERVVLGDNVLAGINDYAPLIYGRVLTTPKIPTVTIHGNKLILLCVWGYGEIDGIEQLLINDIPPQSGVIARHYLGVASQGVDSTLAAAIPGYSDTLVSNGVPLAHSVVEVPAGESTGFPRISAIIRGRKVHDPRTGNTAYSSNPSLCLADLITSTTYGQGRTAIGVEAAGNANDELVGNQPRRAIGLVLEHQSTTEAVEDLTRYAGVMSIPDAGNVALVPDRPADAIDTVDDGQIYPDSFKLSRDSSRTAPTVAVVSYTDTGSIPWRQGHAYAYRSGVQNGTVHWREEQISMPGILSGVSAMRIAKEQIAKGELTGLKIKFQTTEQARQWHRGDVINVDHSRWSGAIRIDDVNMDDIAHFTVTGTQYDASVYSNDDVFAELVTPPPIPRADNPAVPGVDGAVSGTATYQVKADGTIENGVKITIQASTDPNICSYRVKFREAGTSGAWLPGQVEGLTAWLRPVVEQKTYDYQVTAVNCFGFSSDPYSGSHTVQNKDAPPGQIDSITATTDNDTGLRTITINDSSPEADLQGYELERSNGGTYLSITGSGGVTKQKIYPDLSLPTGSFTIRARKIDTSGQAGPWQYTNSTYFPPPPIVDVNNSINNINDDITGINGDINQVNTTIGTLDNRINLLEAFSDGVVNITRGPYFPSGARDGDLHYRSDQGDRLYRRSNGTWVDSSDDRIAQALADAIDAEALADSKARIFAQANQPVASGVGDLWLESDNKYKQRRWNGSSWQDVDRLQPNVIETLHVVNNAISKQASASGSLAAAIIAPNTPVGICDLSINCNGGYLIATAQYDQGTYTNIEKFEVAILMGGQWRDHVPNASGTIACGLYVRNMRSSVGQQVDPPGYKGELNVFELKK